MPRGGGFSRSPSVSAPRPSPRPSPGGGRPGGAQLGGGRPSTLPSRPQPGGGRPGGPGSGLGNRPGGIGNRPGIDNRPGGVGGIGNRPGIDNRPGGVGGIGNRPGIDNRPGGIGGIGNRPIIGSGNTINRGDVNVGGIRQNNLAGIGVDPGYGVRPPAYNNWRGAYWGYHQGWANGYWHGYHADNYGGWGWGRFAAGAAVGVTAWALGSSIYDWGYSSYANPYYGGEAVAQPIVIEQTVVGGEPQTVSVPALAYDYSQPINTQAAPPPAEAADPALAKFDAAREAFRTGDYSGALRLTDEALKVLPIDATLHEFRALVLFAAGKYDLAAGPLYAVLSVGPGWDWTTMAGLYPNIDVYTAQLRALEAFVGANLSSTAARFVLAYHYLTQGHINAAVAQLKQVTALAPQDTLSAQLVRQFTKPNSEPSTPPAPPAPTTTEAPVKPGKPPGTSTPPAPPAPTTTEAPVKPGKLPGNWTARPNKDTTNRLNVADDGAFTWTVDAKGKVQQLAGKWVLADDLLTLAQSGQGGALVGHVTWQADNRWGFRVIGAGPEDPGLCFTR
ncbi:MAG: tetratricopeptide repeat protein [Isosphaerales bacterium]